MVRLPRVTGKEAIRALERAGFRVVRTSGSHHVLVDPRHPERVVVIPFKTSTLKLGTLRSILRQADLTVEAFQNLL